MMAWNKDLGRILRNCREDKKNRQQDLAGQVQRSKQAVSAWEKGKSEPDSETKDKLAMPRLVKCEHCQRRISSEAIRKVDGQYVCPGCVPLMRQAAKARKIEAKAEQQQQRQEQGRAQRQKVAADKQARADREADERQRAIAPVMPVAKPVQAAQIIPPAVTGVDAQGRPVQVVQVIQQQPQQPQQFQGPPVNCRHCGGSLSKDGKGTNEGSGCIVFIIGVVLSPILIGIVIAIYGLHLMTKREGNWRCNNCEATFPRIIKWYEFT